MEKTTANPGNPAKQDKAYSTPGLVIGYQKGKSKEKGNPYVRLEVIRAQNPNWGGEGYGVGSVFLPAEEHHKATPDIIGKVVSCESKSDLFGRTERYNFQFID